VKLNTRWTAAAVIAGVLTLAACSSDETLPDTVPATPTAEAAAPAQSATPSPTPLSNEQAGARYLELVGAPNALTEQWNSAISASDWTTVRTLAQSYADANRTFADGLMAAEWPPAAQPAVDGLVAELAAEISGFVQIAGSTTDDETVAALNTFPARGSSAQQLRMILGLENVPAG
jgi:hypothetical protein